MAPSRCRAAARPAAVFVGLAACASCGLRTTAPGPTASPTPSVSAADPGIRLPPGSGRDVLLRACIDCHDLGGLNLFRSFYARDEWHELVLTMVSHGAALGNAEVELLADYLAEHFGPEPAAP